MSPAGAASRSQRTDEPTAHQPGSHGSIQALQAHSACRQAEGAHRAGHRRRVAQTTAPRGPDLAVNRTGQSVTTARATGPARRQIGALATDARRPWRRATDRDVQPHRPARATLNKPRETQQRREESPSAQKESRTPDRRGARSVRPPQAMPHLAAKGDCAVSVAAFVSKSSGDGGETHIEHATLR